MAIGQFSELQGAMEEFQEKLRVALENHKLTLLKTIDAYKADVDSLEIQQQKSRAKLTQLIEDEKTLKNEIESSEREKDENAAKMEVYRLRKQQLENERAALTADANKLQHLLTEKHDEIRNKRKHIQEQQQRDIAEVNAYSHVLGLDIEAPAPQVLQFVFHRVSESDPTASCEISLDLSQTQYKLTESRPSLSRKTLDELELNLNDTGDLSHFLKVSRAALIRELDTVS
ncbi:LAME_0G01948g1_1 [Lachancea meyersii CBS 8951]|uniref:Kinetochore protein SPC25 n=1 Tax=Lachancea meyersii CBS 8951 TaxID=1266667 RepID=A0A1G4K5W7_9SACH|nr:LAME_0G01948g1_1 [Lachancea meyersii CBS 8951]